MLDDRTDVASVVKVQTLDHALVPKPFVAFARQ